MPAFNTRFGGPFTGSPEDVGLNASELELCDAAKMYCENSYAPYTGYLSGAAVRTSDGKIFGGASLENESTGLCICAEAAALSHANTLSKRQIFTIAIYAKRNDDSGPSHEPAVPCGGCRQLIYEASVRHGREIVVVASNADMNRFTKAGISRLLPNAFGPENLDNETVFDEDEAEMIEVIQSSLDERAEAFMKKDPMKRQKERLVDHRDEKLEGILDSISKRFRKRSL